MRTRKFQLTGSERTTLENGFKNHPKSHFRRRCHALLLCDAGRQIKDVAKLYNTRTRTIYTWMDRWRGFGLAGLYILPGRGLKAKLSQLGGETVILVKKKVRKLARSLKKMAAELTVMLGFKVTRPMLRRYLKKLGYSWKRFRKSLKKKQAPKEYKAKLAQLKQLIELYNTGFIDLFFADESGFNMEGHVPYGWQPKNEYIEITPSKTRGTQIFGLMGLNNRLEAYSCKGSVTSDVVIAFIDDFGSTIKQPTAIVIDNAPIHHSKKFEAKIAEWEEQDLYIFFLPTYSPHLNPIEILWRFIKYQWLPYESLTSQEELDVALEEILNNFGTEYTINFKELKKNEVSIIYE